MPNETRVMWSHFSMLKTRAFTIQRILMTTRTRVNGAFFIRCKCRWRSVALFLSYGAAAPLKRELQLTGGRWKRVMETGPRDVGTYNNRGSRMTTYFGDFSITEIHIDVRNSTCSGSPVSILGNTEYFEYTTLHRINWFTIRLNKINNNCSVHYNKHSQKNYEYNNRKKRNKKEQGRSRSTSIEI